MVVERVDGDRRGRFVGDDEWVTALIEGSRKSVVNLDVEEKGVGETIQPAGRWPINRLKSSYFETCDRDDEGRCLPAGQSGASVSAEDSTGINLSSEETAVKSALQKARSALSDAKQDVTSTASQLAFKYQDEGLSAKDAIQRADKEAAEEVEAKYGSMQQLQDGLEEAAANARQVFYRRIKAGPETAVKGLSKKEIKVRMSGELDPLLYSAQRSIGVNQKTVEQVEGGKLIGSYVYDDKKPVGEIGEALEGLIADSPPSIADLVSYRGMRLTSAQTTEIESALNAGKEAVLPLQHPSSFIDSSREAWEFAKPKGHRAQSGTEAVVLKVLIPKGTKVSHLNLSFAFNEHIVSKNKMVRIVGTKRTGAKVVFTGVLEDV